MVQTVESPRDRNIWEERIADLRRYDLDNLELEPINPADLTSWPVQNLTFVRVDGVLRSWDIEREKQQQQQQPQQDQDPSKPPKRMYLMEDAICGLHSQKANLSFLILGGKHGVNYYMGIALPPGDNGNGAPEDDETELAYSSLKSILHSVYNGVDIYKDSFSADTIQSMISPLANNIGVVTGIPALKSPAAILLNLNRSNVSRLVYPATISACWYWLCRYPTLT